MSLVCDKVTVRLGGGTILNDVSVQLEAASFTALLGPNGAGKSTLLRVLSGDLAPTQGRVLLHDRPVEAFPLSELAAYRSVMTQSNVVAFDFTVREILEMGWIAGSNAERELAFQRVVSTLELAPFLHRQFNRLSGGEQQRVQYGRILLQAESRFAMDDARFLLLDEPTASLDLLHELMLLRNARSYVERGFGVIVVLHDLNLAARFAERVILLSEGQVAADGAVADVLRPALLSEVYCLPLSVEHNKQLDRLIVHS